MKHIIVSIMLLLTLGVQAQTQRNDADRLTLKGNVNSMLEITRNAHNQMLGQPIRYIFNDKGFFEHIHYFDTAGNLAITVHYIYDKKNCLIKDTRLLEPFSQLDGITEYSYNKRGRTLRGDLLLNDTVTLTTFFCYDKNGYETEIREMDELGEVASRVTKEYDCFGNMVRKIHYEGKNNLYRGEFVYRYDTEGYVVEENVMDLNHVRWSLLYSYVFDSHGNWTHCYKFRVTTTEASLYEVVTRQIDYAE